MKKIPLAIVAALKDELRVLRSKVNVDMREHRRPALFELCEYLHKEMLIVQSGIGKDAMGKAMLHCMEKFLPDLCIHVGYCGGASPDEQPGDLIIANFVVDSSTKEEFSICSELIGEAMKVCSENNLRAKIAKLVTVEKAVLESHNKAFVGTEFGANGIDMESSVLVSHCKKNAVPCLVVRSVLDSLDTNLPDMNDLLGKNGETSGLAIVEHMMSKPADILEFPKIGFLANKARTSITGFIDAWLTR